MFNPLIDHDKLDKLSQEELVEKIDYLRNRMNAIRPSGNSPMYNQISAIYMGHVAFYNQKFRDTTP
jgi:hypothetical protein